MFKFLKKMKCHHNFEIVTRGKSTSNYSFDHFWYYHITTATCVECGYQEVLDTEEVQYADHSKLIKVHRDPSNKYDWFKREEALKDD